MNRNSGEKMIFSWTNRVPFDIIELENKERSERMKRGVNPVTYGKLHQVHRGILFKFSNTPSLFDGSVSSLRESTHSMLEKSKHYVESHLHRGTLGEELNHIVDESKTGKTVDLLPGSPMVFSWKNRRPIDIINMEETERFERMKRKANPVLVGKWHQVHNQVRSYQRPVPVLTKVLNTSEGVMEKMYTGLSHLVHDVYDIAKEKLHFSESLVTLESIRASEEIERKRRMTMKIDPVVESRKRRVQEELMEAVKTIRQSEL